MTVNLSGNPNRFKIITISTLHRTVFTVFWYSLFHRIKYNIIPWVYVCYSSINYIFLNLQVLKRLHPTGGVVTGKCYEYNLAENTFLFNSQQIWRMYRYLDVHL